MSVSSPSAELAKTCLLLSHSLCGAVFGASSEGRRVRSEQKGAIFRRINQNKSRVIGGGEGQEAMSHWSIGGGKSQEYMNQSIRRKE
jgi:hypothetical protein